MVTSLAASAISTAGPLGPGLVQGRDDGRDCGVDHPLSQSEQRQAGLRAAAAQARLPVGLLRGLGLAPQAVELADLVEGRANASLTWRSGQSLAGAPRLVERVGPASVELEDFRAAEEALPPERHQIGLKGAPPGQRGGPFPCPAPVEDLLAARDHAAVHIARHDRGNLTGRDCHHRFVE
jgi:hypothetical protein